jgi:hypothetical protein
MFTHFAKCHKELGYQGYFIHSEELYPHLKKYTKQDGVVITRFVERSDLLDKRWDGAVVCKRKYSSACNDRLVSYPFAIAALPVSLVTRVHVSSVSNRTRLLQVAFPWRSGMRTG